MPTTQLLHRASNSNMSNIHLSSSLLHDSSQTPSLSVAQRVNPHAQLINGMTISRGLQANSMRHSRKGKTNKNSPQNRSITHQQSFVVGTQPSISPHPTSAQNSVLNNYAQMKSRPGNYHLFSNQNINIGIRRSLYMQSDEGSANSYERANLFTAQSSNQNNNAADQSQQVPMTYFANQRLHNFSNQRNFSQTQNISAAGYRERVKSTTSAGERMLRNRSRQETKGNQKLTQMISRSKVNTP